MGAPRKKDKKRKREESYSYDEGAYSSSRSESPKRKKRRHREKKRKGKDRDKDKKRRRRARRPRRREEYSSDYDYSSRSKSPARQRGGVDKTELKEFVKFNKLNDEVAERLLNADREVAALVISQGKNVIDNARNANAVVIQRIRKHEVDLGIANRGPPRRRSPVRSAPVGGGDAFKEGDWYCRACDAHNFSKRVDCFKCGRPRDRGRSRSARKDETGPPAKRSRSRSRDGGEKADGGGEDK
mmetsp:Transcript_129533/g.375180  ORF Transcript_129533/g.375180 Transcript_129533/m.375180 type:complete len:242 (-) Transcript_129533:115-840(-)